MQVTNLSNVLFFSEKNKVFKKKNKSFLKFDLLFFPITVSTCRNALFLLQIFQPFRKRPARRHSGWRICIVKCFSRKISFRKNDSLRIGGRSVRLKHSTPSWRIPEPNPSAGMPTGKGFAERLKLLKEFSFPFFLYHKFAEYSWFSVMRWFGLILCTLSGILCKRS